MSQTCYELQNHPQPITYKGPVSCNTSSTSSFVQCCNSGSTCLQSGFCLSPNPTGEQTGYYIGGCTDASYNDSSCVPLCDSWPRTDVVWAPNTSEWACCGVDENGNPHCATPTNTTFNSPAPEDLKAYTQPPQSGVSPTTTSPITSPSNLLLSSSTIPSAASSSETGTQGMDAVSSASASPGLTIGAEIGIGIGVRLLGLALIALIVILLKKRRTRRLNNRTATRETAQIQSKPDKRRTTPISPMSVVEVGSNGTTVPELFSGRRYQGEYVHELGVEPEDQR